MIRFIMAIELMCFVLAGAVLGHQNAELAEIKATMAIYRQLSLKELGEVKV